MLECLTNDQRRVMQIVLYRRTLSLTSGGGQLIRMQAEGLRSAGEQVRIACQRGGLRFMLRSGMRASKGTVATLGRLADSPNYLLVDHGMEVPQADLVFVHNVMIEAVRHIDRPDWVKRAAEEEAFFSRLAPHVKVVANSNLVRDALLKHFSLRPERVDVQYPGFDSARFHAPVRGGQHTPAESSKAEVNAGRLRRQARADIAVSEHEPLIGFVTSGEFGKRGLDIFLDAAERIASVRPDLRFLVVGGKRLPEQAARHRLVGTGRVTYRPKSLRPQRWFAALDIFLYPALFEEFGMVVSEAQASGLPVLTSRRVGAAECLAPAYEPWLIDAPDGAAFAAKALALLEDDDARAELSRAGMASIPAYDREHYVQATVETIRQCSREKVRSGGSGTG
ncbi:MAG: glycosyltransferase family 4 protein [Woeseia sp.]